MKPLLSTEQFVSVLKGVIQKCPPISGINLEGMIEDVWHSLGEAAIFIPVKVRKTGQPESLIEVLCRCSASGLSSADIARQLEAVWLDNLRYRSGDEVHTISETDDTVTLKAVTVSGTNGYYVSMTIEVDTAQVAGRNR